MISIFKRPPFIGLFAFLMVFILQGLGHTQMVLMQRLFGEEHVIAAAIVMGIVGTAIVYWGVRRNDDENLATWLGFIGGTLIWDGWVEFSYVFYAMHLGLPPLIENGEVVTKAEYLMMPSSIGVLFSSLVFFFFNRETRCNAFRWLHRNLHLQIGKPTLGYQRNVSTIVAMETIYVIWFFYVFLLVIYDKRILGDDHPAMYGILFVFVVWSVYLLNRLRKFTRVTSAFRYGIPTAIIAYNVAEILGRWNMYADIWIEPEKYTGQLSAIFGGLIVVAGIFALFPSTDVPDAEGAPG